jgi:predicted TIM-barrel fold metal-dependent hydrolase
MKSSPLVQRLIAAFEQFDIIDCHEHLPPESVRVSQSVDALTLFGHYTRTDLMTAGMSAEDYQKTQGTDLPLDQRWQLLRPYLPHIRFGSYARPAFIAAREFYGFDDISDSTYEALSAAMAAANTPGIYTRVLREKCRIRTSLTQGGRTDYDLDLLVPLMPMDHLIALRKPEDLEKRCAGLGLPAAATLTAYVDVMRAGIRDWKNKGVVGMKMASNPFPPVDRAEASRAFRLVAAGETLNDAAFNALRIYLLEQIYEIAADENFVVAVHAGMWGDFRTLDPQHMIPILMRHPRTRFDLYHMGMPWVRETGVIGKNFPNVWLNLCWCHVISPVMTRAALDEWIDLVPVNKIFAFGGDYGKPVEKVYGHLVMAREDIAMVLGRRVEQGLMTEDQAVAVAHRWFYDNPKEVYGLKG